MIPGKAHVGGGGGGDGMFAGMDPRLAAEAEKMWKALEDMSANDPAAYQQFIKEQMREGAAEGFIPPTPDMPVPGRRVRVHSLVKMAEYNGREGVVRSVLEGGRMCVLLDPGKEAAPSPSKELSLKPTNLTVLGTPTPAVTDSKRSKATGGGAQPLADIAIKPKEDDEQGMEELALPSNAPSKRPSAGPLIQEVSASINSSLAEPEYSHKIVVSGHEVSQQAQDQERQLVLAVRCPHAASVGDIEVQVSTTEIFVDAEGQRPLRFPLQHTVDVDSLTAKFNKKKRSLTLTMGIL